MRIHEWRAIVDGAHSIKKTPLIYRDAGGALHAASISRIVDSRSGPPSSDDLLSIENPLLQDVDGLILRVNDQLCFVAAALLHPDFYERRSIPNGESFYAGYPKDLVCFMQYSEQSLVYSEPHMTNEKFEQSVRDILSDVEAMYLDDALTYGETKAAFDNGSAYGAWFLDTHADRLTFNALASAAQCASWQAKFVKNHGGTSRPLYELKNKYLNQLLLKYLTSATHQRIELSMNNGELGIVCEIPVRIMGTKYSAYHRRMHLPLDCITKESAMKIAYVHPALFAKMRTSSRCPTI